MSLNKFRTSDNRRSNCHVTVPTSLPGTWTRSVTCRLSWKRPPRRNKRSKIRYRTPHVEPPAGTFHTWFCPDHLIAAAYLSVWKPAFTKQQDSGDVLKSSREIVHLRQQCLEDGDTWGYQFAFCTRSKYHHLSLESVLTVVLGAVILSALTFIQKFERFAVKDMWWQMTDSARCSVLECANYIY